MKSNVGGIDKIIRIAAGIGLLAFFALGEGASRYWGLAGIVPLVTRPLQFLPGVPAARPQYLPGAPLAARTLGPAGAPGPEVRVSAILGRERPLRARGYPT